MLWFERVHPYGAVATVAIAAFVLAALAVWAGRRAVLRSLERLDIINEENRAGVHARARQVIRALKLAAYGIAALVSLSLLASRLSIDVPSLGPREVVAWMLVHGVHIVALVAAAHIVIRAAHLAIEHVQYKAPQRIGGLTDPERQRRARTLSGITSNLVTVVVGALAGLMILRELSIDVLPLLTGAGIAGLAIGFGAQNLVRDVISGFFLILEDQIRVGDIVRVNTIGGAVEEINLRTIVLRDLEGAVHVFPNGAITALANLSKDFSYAVVDVGVARGENMDRVMDTLREIGAQMQAAPALGPVLLEPIEVLGVEAIGAAQVTIRTRFKTAPLKHGDIARELRRRIVSEFAARGIARAG